MFLYFLKCAVFCVYMFLVCVEALKMRNVKQIIPKEKIRKEKKDANYVERRR